MSNAKNLAEVLRSPQTLDAMRHAMPEVSTVALADFLAHASMIVESFEGEGIVSDDSYRDLFDATLSNRDYFNWDHWDTFVGSRALFNAIRDDLKVNAWEYVEDYFSSL